MGYLDHEHAASNVLKSVTPVAHAILSSVKNYRKTGVFLIGNTFDNGIGMFCKSYRSFWWRLSRQPLRC